MNLFSSKKILKYPVFIGFLAVIFFINSANSKALGSFEVDEEASVRALENSLVQSGSLLLGTGKFEIGMGLSFSRNENNIPMFIAADNNTKIIKNTFGRSSFPFYLRAGLPYEMQIDLSIPLHHIRQQSIYITSENTVTEVKQRGSGVGDVEIKLSKTLVREQGNLPDMIGYVSWNAANGKKSDNNIVLSDGMNDFKVGITATRTQDPLVFSVSASAQGSREKNNIKLGNQYTLSLATFLAASPSTSLKFSIDQFFIDKTKVNNKELIGSDKTVALLNLGVSSSISSKTFLSLSAGAGLTNDSPDYVVNLSLSTRFDLH